MMTLADLDGRLFASVPEVAQLLDGADPRTVRRMCETGEIPSIRVGTHIKIPVSWLCEYLGAIPASERSAEGQDLDLDQLAERVADRVMARVLGAIVTLASGAAAAGPVPPGPAATDDNSNPLPTSKKPRDEGNTAA